jgi:hypothetical protein
MVQATTTIANVPVTIRRRIVMLHVFQKRPNQKKRDNIDTFFHGYVPDDEADDDENF